MTELPKVAAFRAASAACQQDLLAVLRRYGGELGPVEQFDTVIELAGCMGKALLEAAPIAQTQIHVATRLRELVLWLVQPRASH